MAGSSRRSGVNLGKAKRRRNKPGRHQKRLERAGKTGGPKALTRCPHCSEPQRNVQRHARNCNSNPNPKNQNKN